MINKEGPMTWPGTPMPTEAVPQAKEQATPMSEPSDRADLIAKLRADFKEDRVDFDNIKAAADMLEADAQCTHCKVVADDNNEHIQRAYRAEAMLAQQVAVPPTPASENPHQDYLARYWQLGYDGGDLGACSGDAPLRAYREGKATKAQQVAVPQEPTLYIHKDQLAFLRTMHGDESAQARYANGFTSWLPDSVKAEFIPLYAAPQSPQAARPPMTDYEIKEMAVQGQFLLFLDGIEELTAIVRAIEQAVRGKT